MLCFSFAMSACPAFEMLHVAICISITLAVRHIWCLCDMLWGCCRAANEKGAEEEAERQLLTVKKLKGDVTRKEGMLKACQAELDKVLFVNDAASPNCFVNISNSHCFCPPFFSMLLASAVNIPSTHNVLLSTGTEPCGTCCKVPSEICGH